MFGRGVLGVKVRWGILWVKVRKGVLGPRIVALPALGGVEPIVVLPQVLPGLEDSALMRVHRG